MKKYILASASPRRKDLLSQIGLEFEIITSDAPEISHASAPEDIVRELSCCKAKAVWESHGKGREDTVVIGADTLVFDGTTPLGKPRDTEDARRMLLELSGKTHKVCTGVTLLCGSETRSFCETAEVTVCEMTTEEINAYIKTGEPMDKAGAYGIQGRFAAYVKAIRGDYNAIVGLPVCRLYQELKTAGWL